MVFAGLAAPTTMMGPLLALVAMRPKQGC